jgi:hypothetical protein
VFPTHGQVRIAGPYVAVATGDPISDEHSGGVAVYDWRSGDRVYEVEGPKQGVEAFDVREDGTVVLLSAAEATGEQGSELDWASPQEPFAHRIANVGEPNRGEVRIAGSQAAARVGGRFRVFDLDGRERASAAAGEAVGSFDFDGQRLVFAAQPCESLWMVSWDLAGSPPARPAGHCPRFALAPSAAVAHVRRRAIGVPLRCPAAPALGCSGELSLVLRPRVSTLDSRLVALGPGERTTLRLKLSRRQACSYSHGLVKQTRLRLTHPTYTRRPTERGHQPLLEVRVAGRAQGCER